MNKIKKLAGAIMLTITVSTLGISVQPLDVAAETLTYMTKKPTTCTFDSAWERTRQIYEYDSSAIVGTLCYGYDTVLINEDYVWTQSAFYNHKSYFANGSSAHTSKEYKASADSKWAKYEQTHSGSNHTYGIRFTNVSGGLTQSSFSLGSEQLSHHKE